MYSHKVVYEDLLMTFAPWTSKYIQRPARKLKGQCTYKLNCYRLFDDRSDILQTKKSYEINAVRSMSTQTTVLKRDCDRYFS